MSFKKLVPGDKVGCAATKGRRGGGQGERRETWTLANVVSSGCSGLGYLHFDFSSFLLQPVSLQLNDGYLFQVTNPLNSAPAPFAIRKEPRMAKRSRTLWRVESLLSGPLCPSTLTSGVNQVGAQSQALNEAWV